MVSDIAEQGWPSFDGSGARIVYLESNVVYSVLRDGSSQILINDAVSHETAHCARDGRITTGNGNINNIWTMDADGPNRTKLTTTNGRGPLFSPDGEKIIYFSIDDGGAFWDVW